MVFLGGGYVQMVVVMNEVAPMEVVWMMLGMHMRMRLSDMFLIYV